MLTFPYKAYLLCLVIGLSLGVAGTIALRSRLSAPACPTQQTTATSSTTVVLAPAKKTTKTTKVTKQAPKIDIPGQKEDLVTETTEIVEVGPTTETKETTTKETNQTVSGSKPKWIVGASLGVSLKGVESVQVTGGVRLLGDIYGVVTLSSPLPLAPRVPAVGIGLMLTLN